MAVGKLAAILFACFVGIHAQNLLPGSSCDDGNLTPWPVPGNNRNYYACIGNTVMVLTCPGNNIFVTTNSEYFGCIPPYLSNSYQNGYYPIVYYPNNNNNAYYPYNNNVYYSNNGGIPIPIYEPNNNNNYYYPSGYNPTAYYPNTNYPNAIPNIPIPILARSENENEES